MYRIFCSFGLLFLVACATNRVTSAYHLQKLEVERTPMIAVYLVEPAVVKTPVRCYWHARDGDYPLRTSVSDLNKVINPPPAYGGEDWIDVHCEDDSGDNVDVGVVFTSEPSWTSRFNGTKFVPLEDILIRAPLTLFE